MHFGWRTDEELRQLEDLIANKNGYTDTERPDGWFRSIADQVKVLPDDLAVEITRICLINLAARHAGVDMDRAIQVSDEGIEHSLYRVLELLKRSVPNE